MEGLLTARDINDFAVSATEKGGKKQYLKDISERVGLGSETSMAEPPTYLKGTLGLDQQPLFVTIGQAELPHPFKSVHGESERGRPVWLICFVPTAPTSPSASHAPQLSLHRNATIEYSCHGP